MSNLTKVERIRSPVQNTITELNQAQLKNLPVAELLKRLQSSVNGLDDTEAKRRIEEFGYNELPEKKTNPFLKFLSYFWGPIPIMISIAAIISGVLHRWPDLGVILTLLVLNAVVGFREEFQAGNAVAALKQKLAMKANVRRDGKWSNIPARELVPGDIIRLRIGNIIPADAKLLEGDPVQVDQSALTGESLPVEHKPGDTVYSGSIVKQGEINALIYGTGTNTYYGKTVELVETAHTQSHLQRAVIKIADYLILIAIFLAIIIFVVAVFRGDPFLQVLQFALILTIASVPVALPTVLSVTMALGAHTLARKEAIVTRLSAVEELAGTDILCSDKTGTLTQNKLTIGTPFTLNGISADDVILCAALASQVDNQDAIDLAILGGLKNKQVLDSYQLLHFLPFDPVHKRTEATVKDTDGHIFKTTKGAPQVILALNPGFSQIQPQVEKAVGEFATRGFRSLGVARTEGQDQWQFLGVIPLYDPLRDDAKTTIETAGQMGIHVKMVTGDQVAIAKEIGSQLGLGKNILDASVFSETKAHETSQLDEAIEQADGFAQVFPEHKYHIVNVLQQRGHIVGMTGDGVNDAPALKKADVGIAVANSTDAARAASAIVLLTPGLSVIIDAIKEARKIFQRMTNYTIYRIAETVRVLLFLTLSTLVFNFYPITAIMIVLLAILNDGAILTIAYDNVRYSNQPERWDMRSVLGIATVLGFVGVIASFGLFYLGETVFNLSRDTLQSLMYLKLSVAGHLTVFVTRTRGPFWSVKPAPILLGAVIGTQLVATFIAVYGLFMSPLGWTWAGFVWGYALVWFLISDRVKMMACRIFDRQCSGWYGKRHKSSV